MENFLTGIPAPLWLMMFLKVLGFVLHLVPMGLWAVGLPLAVAAACCSSQEKPLGRFGNQVLRQLPIFVALGVNFGIVPLLFLQTIYPKPFYTATILVAWHWIIIIPLLLVGYYAVYLTAFAAKEGRAAAVLPLGLIASLCFILIGLLMSNGLTLIAHPERWALIFEKTQIAGAVTGLGNNMRDPTFPWRLATLFSLALITVALWALVDACVLAEGTRDENRPYRRWAIRFATCFTFLAAALLSGIEGAIKNGFPWSDDLARDYPCFGYVPLLAVVLFVLLLFVWIKGDYGARMLSAVVLIYTSLLAVFGIIRQWGQHETLTAVAGLTDLTENVQWEPVLMFLITFVGGVLCITWIIRQLALAPPDLQEKA
ncbi:MAG TPA: hypothetical protein DEB39_05795 [Planctomycetaceae bacterium]|nr:hypothetical protein [Planctomycetaceae bacterium]